MALQGRKSASLTFYLTLSLIASAHCQIATAPAIEKRTITVGKSTTIVTGPIRPDGTVNMPSALNEQLLEQTKGRQNVLGGLVRCVGPLFTPERNRAFFLKALNVVDLPDRGKYFVALDDFLRDKGKSNQEIDALTTRVRQLNHAWKPDEQAELADWLISDDNGKNLDSAVTAILAGNCFWVPLDDTDAKTPLFSMPMWSCAISRNISLGLLARSTQRAGLGDITGAISDSLALHRLGRLMTRNCGLTLYASGLTAELMAANADAAIIGSGKLDAKTIGEYLRETQALPPRGDLLSAIRIERLGALDEVMGVAAGNGASFFEDSAADAKYLVASEDVMAKVKWDNIIYKFNSRYDDIEKALRLRTYVERNKALHELSDQTAAATKELLKDFNEVKPEEQLARALFINECSFADEFGGANALHDKAAMVSDLNEVILAIASFEAQEGSLPKELEALIPKYLNAVPPDSFGPAKLQYEVTPSGFILKFTGLDRKQLNASDTVDPSKAIIFEIKRQ